MWFTALKVPKFGVFSGLYFPLFGMSTGKDGIAKPPYWDTFHVVFVQSQDTVILISFIFKSVCVI